MEENVKIIFSLCKDFNSFEFYGDIAGKEFSDTGETICGFFTK